MASFCVAFEKYIAELGKEEQEKCLDQYNGLMCIMCPFYADRKLKIVRNGHVVSDKKSG